MSLTKVSYSMIAGAPINVVDYGVVGNNSADDTAAIQAAIDAMINGSTLDFEPGKTYRVTAPIVVPPNLTGCVFRGNGSIIRADHNGDGLVMVATNQNFSRHKVYDLTIQGPNVSYPNNAAELIGTSTGAALKMGYDDTSNMVAGYLTSFYNCAFTNFYSGVYLQSTILINFYGGYIFFNQIGVYVDSGQTNANTFYSVGIKENRQFGVYSSPRAGGSLSYATNNKFYSCVLETNIPYDLSSGGYPSTFDPSTGHAIKLWNSYDWIFDGCYFENHNYSVLVESSSDDNIFQNCRFDSESVRHGWVVIGGASCNNKFVGCKMVDYGASTDGTFQVLAASSHYNQLVNSTGFRFDPSTSLGTGTYISNIIKSQGTAGNGQYFGVIAVPSQGILSNPGEGTNQGDIDGIGTTTATLNAFGYSHFVFGSQITSNTTINAISNMVPGQLLVLTNYQTAFTVTLESSTLWYGDLVLKNRRTVKLNQYGQSITLFCNALSKIVEVGRNFSDRIISTDNISDVASSVIVTFAAAGYPAEPDTAYNVLLSVYAPSDLGVATGSMVAYPVFSSITTAGFTIQSLVAPGAGKYVGWTWEVIR